MALIDELRGVDRQEGIPKKRVQRLYLPGDAKSWNVYRAGGPWSVGHQVGQLQPAKFGGLDCEVLAWKISGIVAVIKTKDFGVVGIYVAVGSIHPFFFSFGKSNGILNSRTINLKQVGN